MATAQQLIEDLDEKLAQLKQAVQALEEASGRVAQPDVPREQATPAGDQHADHA